MWDSNGLLISDNPQSSSLVDYDLVADQGDNAVIVFTDTRNAGNLNVFAYRINPDGDFLWGLNGVSLSATADFQPNPKVTQTNDGNFVIVWIIATSPEKVALQKLSPDGVKLWGNDPILIESVTEGYSNPNVVPTDSNGVIVIHTTITGTFPGQTIKIKATKVTSDASFSWGTMLQDLGGIAFFLVPQVYSDFNDGAIVSWHDDRNGNNLQEAFVQRISSNNTIYFPDNGANASLTPTRNKFNPVTAFDTASVETYLFWIETEPNQSQNGISGQRLSSNGTRLWTDNGKIFKDLSTPNTVSISNLNTKAGSGKTYVFYLEGDAGGLNDMVEGFVCDSIGDFIWTNNFVTLSNSTQQKLHMVSTVDAQFNCKMSWSDDRGSSRDIYAQDINPDGILGDPIIVSVKDEISFPLTSCLKQNYPNPFNPTTTIRYTIPQDKRGKTQEVGLKIYDVLGNEVATLLNEEKPAGNYEVEFQSAVGSRHLASGIYYYQLRVGNFVETKKMVLMK